MDKRKWPDRPHYAHEATWLGEDESGTWLALTPGVPVLRGDEVLFVAEGSGAVVLAPRDDWWLAMFAFERDFSLYVDIATPPTWEGDTMVMVDLDFDVVRFSDGRVVVEDEDEFEEHRVRYTYPPWLEAGARAAAARVHEAVVAGDAPFAEPSARWADLARSVVADATRRSRATRGS